MKKLLLAITILIVVLAAWQLVKKEAPLEVPDRAHVEDPPVTDREYMDLLDWPPQAQTLAEPYSCTEAGEPEARVGITEERVINGRVYCVTEVTEGAAGSIYSQYAYATAKGGQTLILTFSTRRVQCANFNEPEKSECEAEQQSFSADELAAQAIGPYL